MTEGQLIVYQIDPLFNGGLYDYQTDCQFYHDDWQVRDQLMSVCESVFDQMEIRKLSEDECRALFIKGKLVLAKLPKAEDYLQEDLNKKRMEEWIHNKLIKNLGFLGKE